MLVHLRCDVVAQRHEKMVQCKHTIEYIWQKEDNTNIFVENKVAWEKHFLVNHGGSENEFLPSSGENFVVEEVTSDYHEKMNSVYFER